MLKKRLLRKRRKVTLTVIAVIFIALTILLCHLKVHSVFEPEEEEVHVIKENNDELKQETSSEEETIIQWEPYEFIPLDGDVQEEIYEICCEYNISYELILSMIEAESNFDVNAMGDNGNSVGLMQIQPRWWQGLADENKLDIYDPVDNVQIGVIILNLLLEENNGDLDKALKQYNSGNPNDENNGYAKTIFEKCESIERRKDDKSTGLR